MMTKVLAEDEARALFRSQEIDKLNNERFLVGMAISEKEISGCHETAEAVPNPTASDERMGVRSAPVRGSLEQDGGWQGYQDLRSGRWPR